MKNINHTIAIIGAGIIGTSWAAKYSVSGYKVRMYDIRENFQRHIADYLKQMIGQISDNIEGAANRISYHSNLVDALDGATVVQENGPEKSDFKQEIFASIEKHVNDNTLIISSSSGIPPDIIGKRMKNPDRAIIGHPFNPPHLIPLVEICTTLSISKEKVEEVTEFYASCGKVPVRLNKPIPGFVANRLQTALVREAIYLVQEGVVSVADLDQIMLNSLGIRWAAIGPFLTGQLGGGEGGLVEMVDKILNTLIVSMNLSPVEDKGLKIIGDQTNQFYPLDKFHEVASARDARQIAIMKAQSSYPLPDISIK